MKRTRRSYIWEFLKSAIYVFRYKILRIKPPTNRIGKYKEITMKKSNNAIEEAIRKGEPFAAIRFGAVEISALNNYEKIRLGFRRKYKKSVVYSIKNNAGVFPPTQEIIDFYAKYLETNLKDTDYLGVSSVHMENYFFKHLTPNATPVQNWALDPLLGKWSHLLAGKRVLVISPFAEQIEEQYEKRHLLFQAEPEILPEFTLVTIPAILTSGKAASKEFDNWFEVLDYLKLEILKKDFDIALVGAGAYGTPLCLYIKSLGKMAIQSGGATQLLFGLMGKRWEKREYVARHVNPHWSRPTVKPYGHKNIEGGCYW